MATDRFLAAYNCHVLWATLVLNKISIARDFAAIAFTDFIQFFVSLVLFSLYPPASPDVILKM
jgi:hypothetical protein